MSNLRAHYLELITELQKEADWLSKTYAKTNNENVLYVYNNTIERIKAIKEEVIASEAQSA